MSVVAICTDCGRPRPQGRSLYALRRFTATSYCREDSHGESIEVTDEQLLELVSAMRAYHAAKSVEERARAMTDWMAVLRSGGTEVDAGQQLDLTGGQT